MHTISSCLIYVYIYIALGCEYEIVKYLQSLPVYFNNFFLFSCV